jgi:hypothetical protein
MARRWIVVFGMIALAEVLPVGSHLRAGLRNAWLRRHCGGIRQQKGEPSMKSVRVSAAALALLAIPTTGTFLAPPAHAQGQMPNINLIPELQSKSPEEKEADEARDKAYKESLRKIPDAKASSDPWGTVRADTPKSVPNSATAPSSKSTAATKKTKTGSSAN